MAKSRKSQAPKPVRKNARKPARSPAPQRSTKPAAWRVPKAASPVRPSKKAAIVALLEGPNGAAIGDLINATGWQQHSVRAALTGLRKEGKELVRSKDAGG